MWSIRNGAAAAGTGNVVPALPTGWAADDILVLTCECQFAETVAAPAGWTQLASSPQASVDTKIAQFWRRAVLGDTAPTVVDPGDHVIASIQAIRGAITTGNPFRNTAGSAQATSTTVNLDAVAATAGDLVGLYYAVGRDSTTDPMVSSSLTNADVSIFDRSGAFTTQGNGGGYGWHIFAAPTTASSSGSVAITPTLPTAHISWSMIPDGTGTAVNASRVMLGTVISTRGGGEAVTASRIMLGVVVQTAGPEVIRRRRLRTFYP